jgi:hypothetical protein
LTEHIHEQVNLSMPMNVSWDDDEKTTLRCDYEGKWTWSDVSQGYDEVIKLMKTVPHPVSMIHNMTHGAGIPNGAISNVHRFTAHLPENWGISVVVGSGAFIEMLMSVFTKIYKKLGERYKRASSLEEAREIIRQTAQKIDSAE